METYEEFETFLFGIRGHLPSETNFPATGQKCRYPHFLGSNRSFRQITEHLFS
jgi:hypothetical protein